VRVGRVFSCCLFLCCCGVRFGIRSLGIFLFGELFGNVVGCVRIDVFVEDFVVCEWEDVDVVL